MTMVLASFPHPLVTSDWKSWVFVYKTNTHASDLMPIGRDRRWCERPACSLCLPLSLRNVSHVEQNHMCFYCFYSLLCNGLLWVSKDQHMSFSHGFHSFRNNIFLLTWKRQNCTKMRFILRCISCKLYLLCKYSVEQVRKSALGGGKIRFACFHFALELFWG